MFNSRIASSSWEHFLIAIIFRIIWCHSWYKTVKQGSASDKLKGLDYLTARQERLSLLLWTIFLYFGPTVLEEAISLTYKLFFYLCSRLARQTHSRSRNMHITTVQLINVTTPTEFYNRRISKRLSTALLSYMRCRKNRSFLSISWPWPCTKHNDCLLFTEELTNRNVSVTKLIVRGDGASTINLSISLCSFDVWYSLLPTIALLFIKYGLDYNGENRHSK